MKTLGNLVDWLFSLSGLSIVNLVIGILSGLMVIVGGFYRVWCRLKRRKKPPPPPVTDTLPEFGDQNDRE